MTQTIQQVGAVHAKNDMEGVDNPGTFTVFEDDMAIVCGDGNVTPADATGRFIDWMASKDPAFAPFGDNSSAATLGAQSMLQKNPQLGLAGVDDPIPTGQLFQMDGKSLKQLLAPFANRLDELRTFVVQAGGLDGDRATGQVLGKTRTPGLGIPID